MAYNSLKTGIVKRNLRRILFRKNPNSPFNEYGFDKIHCGDTPAAILTQLGVEKAAETAIAEAHEPPDK